METSQIWGSTNGNEAKVSPRASFIVPAVGLMVVGVLALGAIRANVAPQTAQDQAGMVQLGDFKIPDLPANLIDELKKETKQPITEFKADLGINDLRGDQIALCVINLNLGIWKVIQVGALITKTVDNCAYQTTNIDKKIACNIILLRLRFKVVPEDVFIVHPIVGNMISCDSYFEGGLKLQMSPVVT